MQCQSLNNNINPTFFLLTTARHIIHLLGLISTTFMMLSLTDDNINSFLLLKVLVARKFIKLTLGDFNDISLKKGH